MVKSILCHDKSPILNQLTTCCQALVFVIDRLIPSILVLFIEFMSVLESELISDSIYHSNFSFVMRKYLTEILFEKRVGLVIQWVKWLMRCGLYLAL